MKVKDEEVNKIIKCLEYILQNNIDKHMVPISENFRKIIENVLKNIATNAFSSGCYYFKNSIDKLISSGEEESDIVKHLFIDYWEMEL